MNNPGKGIIYLARLVIFIPATVSVIGAIYSGFNLIMNFIFGLNPVWTFFIVLLTGSFVMTLFKNLSFLITTYTAKISPSPLFGSAVTGIAAVGACGYTIYLIWNMFPKIGFFEVAGTVIYLGFTRVIPAGVVVPISSGDDRRNKSSFVSPITALVKTVFFILLPGHISSQNMR